MTLRVIFCHSAGVFGSKTTHCVPSSIDSRRKEQRAADVDVLQIGVGVAAERARAPDTDVAVEDADAVDALRVEPVLLRFADAVLQTERPKHRLVGRGLVHAALRVDARVDAGDVPARRHKLQARHPSGC